MGKPEAIVEKHLKKQVEKNGGQCYKYSSSSKVGLPDRIVVLKHSTVFVEVKAREDIEPSPRQKYRHRQIREATGEVRVLGSKAQVDAFIAEMTDSDTLITRLVSLIQRLKGA